VAESRDDADTGDDEADDVEVGDDHVAADEDTVVEDAVVEPRPASPDAPVRVRELVLLAVAVLAIVGMVFFALRWKDLHDTEVERHDVEEASGQFINALFEWDGATIDEDFDNILSFATGDFEEEAQATFADDDTRQQLREKQAASRVEELDVFVRSIDGNDARVFAVADVTARNIDFPDRRADTVRIEIGMHKTGGEWKVYDVNLLDGLNLGLPATDATTATTVPAEG
jgi:hypothetical protein